MVSTNRDDGVIVEFSGLIRQVGGLLASDGPITRRVVDCQREWVDRHGPSASR